MNKTLTNYQAAFKDVCDRVRVVLGSKNPEAIQMLAAQVTPTQRSLRDLARGNIDDSIANDVKIALSKVELHHGLYWDNS